MQPGTTVAVFEAAIDAMAEMTLCGDAADKYRLSLGGVSSSGKEPLALQEFLRQHPEITTIELRLDNDAKGRMASVNIQNLYREKAMYKDDWESLVGLCDEFLYLGGTEKETHKYVSELLGKETISTTSYNQSKGRSGSYSINHQQSGRDLMTPDEVRLLDNSKCILFIRGERPVVDYKYNLLKHPNIRCTEDGGAVPYDYTAADNARDDLPCAPENYELLDMDDFLPAEAAEMKPTIQRIRRSI